MKTYHISAVLLAAAFTGTAMFAGETAPAAATPAPTAPAAAAVTAAPEAAAPIAINGYVYVDKLPTPTQLMTEAEAENLTIARMEQSAGRIVAVYKYPDGRVRAFAYTTSAPSGADQVQAPLATSTATYTVIQRPPAPTTTVVYADPAPTVVYYDSPRYVRYYDPAWDFWTPLAIGVGLGWGFGGHGHYYGGYHGHGHGGWHR